MTYITKSAEKPIEEVTHSWWKHELQEMKANLLHIHSVLWLADNDGTNDGRQKIVDHIRGSISTIVKYSELSKCLGSGLVSSYHDLVSMLEDFLRILPHKHDQHCAILVRTSTDVNVVGAYGDWELTAVLQRMMRCKVPDNRLLSPNPTHHIYVDVETWHSPDVTLILKKIGLITYPSLSEAEQNGIEQRIIHPKFTDDSLITKQHIPPMSAADPIISPVLGPLAIRNPNNNNNNNQQHNNTASEASCAQTR